MNNQIIIQSTDQQFISDMIDLYRNYANKNNLSIEIIKDSNGWDIIRFNKINISDKIDKYKSNKNKGRKLMNFYDLIKLFSFSKINKRQEIINLFTNELKEYNIYIYKDNSQLFVNLSDKDYTYHNQGNTKFKELINNNNIMGIIHLIYGEYQIDNFDLFYNSIISIKGTK